MINTQSLGAWTGLIGGASGFLALFFQFWFTFHNRPRVSLKVTFAINPSTQKNFYSIEVVNKGAKSITLSNIGVTFSNKMHSSIGLFQPEDRNGKGLPHRLDAYSSETWLVGKEAIKSVIIDLKVEKKVVFYVSLATNKKINSKKIEIIN